VLVILSAPYMIKLQTIPITLIVSFEDISTYSCSKTIPIWTSDIFVIKRTVNQLLSEFLGRQKIRLVGVGISKLRKCLTVVENNLFPLLNLTLPWLEVPKVKKFIKM
jgi:hypothetical protein